MSLIKFIGPLLLVVSAMAAPSFRPRESVASKEEIYNKPMVYNLIQRLMSTGTLRTWLNRHVLKKPRNTSGFFLGSQTNKENGEFVKNIFGESSVQESQNREDETFVTTTVSVEDLTIVRDHMMTSTPPSLQQSTKQLEKSSTKKYNIPIIILTHPDANNLVDDNKQTPDLTIVRDYPESSTTPSVQDRRQNRQKRAVFSLPMIQLKTKDDHDNLSGDVPQTGSLNGEDEEDLIMVRDKTSLDEPVTNSGNSSPVYTGGAAASSNGQSTQGTAQPKVYQIRFYECPNKQGWCFEFI